jgi:hypothetical protein
MGKCGWSQAETGALFGGLEVQGVAQRLRRVKAESQQITEPIGRQRSNAQARPRFYCAAGQPRCRLQGWRRPDPQLLRPWVGRLNRCHRYVGVRLTGAVEIQLCPDSVGNSGRVKVIATDVSGLINPIERGEG